MPDNQVKIRVGADLGDSQAAMDAFAQKGFTELRIHALEARDAVSAIAAKIDELHDKKVSAESLRPIREEFLKAQDEVRRTETAIRNFGKSTDSSLVGTRESARLLSEELGLHLPRAVTSAVSEMLPAIGSLGGGLLGAFAVKEVWDWGKAAVGAIREARGETAELKATMDDIVKEQEDILRHPTNLAEARKDLAETSKRIGDINAEIIRLQRNMTETPTKAAEAVLGAAGAWGAPLMAEAAATSASLDNIRVRLNDLQDELGKLTERQKAQLTETTRLEQEAKKENEQGAASARTHAAAVEHVSQAAHQWRMQMIRDMQQAGVVAKQLDAAQQAQAATTARMAEAELKFALSLEQYGIVGEREIRGLRELAPVIEKNNVAVNSVSLHALCATIPEQFAPRSLSISRHDP